MGLTCHLRDMDSQLLVVNSSSNVLVTIITGIKRLPGSSPNLIGRFASNAMVRGNQDNSTTLDHSSRSVYGKTLPE